MKAAVFHEPNQPLTIENVEHAPLKRREVLVRTAYAGLCHSDLHFIEGLYPFPTPCVLGHEAAGVIEAVGDDVTYVKPGDHVITCLSVFCGECPQCMTGHPNLCENTEVKLLPGGGPGGPAPTAARAAATTASPTARRCRSSARVSAT